MLKPRLLIAVILIISLLASAGCGSKSPGTGPAAPGQESETSQPADKPSETTAAGLPLLKVHFIDVGQADSILIQLPDGQIMLVDAGNNDDGKLVAAYLRENGVQQIDYLFGTHPHEDHIGGLDTVIQNFTIGAVYMPRVTHTTSTFQDVLRAVQAKGLKITPAGAGVELVNTDGLKVSLLAPLKSRYDELNNYSAVIKITYGEVSFLLTGDAEELSETEMLAASEAALKADVLKIGHHGSRSSTSPAFLNAVSPRYAVISTGAGNDYGHPHQETLQRLSKIKVYRTDLDGTIVFSSEGKDINVTTERIAAAASAATPQMDVDSSGQGLIKGNINSRGEKIYHLPGGANYSRTDPEMWFKTEEEARAAGFRPAKS